MRENKEKVELSENNLDRVTGGIDEFPEAEDLPLTGPEKKELKSKPEKKYGIDA